MTERQESGRTYVYRAFDAAGQLLYVGITKNIARRIAKHLSTHWIWDVESLTAEAYDSRREAHAAEVEAIRTERPRWNVMHVPDVQQAISESRSWERKQYTAEWPRHSPSEWVALRRKLRRLAWSIQYGITTHQLQGRTS